MHVGKKYAKCQIITANKKTMEDVSEIHYLGDIVSNNLLNGANIKSRVSKGVGILNEIFNILDNVAFGKNYFIISDSFCFSGEF